MTTKGQLAFPLGVLVALAISTPAFSQPPAAPTNFHVSCALNSASIQWQDNSNNETFFRISRRPPGGAWATVHEAPADTDNWVDLNLATGQVYCYTVTAHNSSGFSDSPLEGCVPTLIEPNLISPGNGQTLPSGTSGVTLDWEPALNASRYSVHLGSSCTNMPELGQTGSTQLTVSGLADGVYCWGVVSLFSNGTTAASASEFTQCWTFTIGSTSQDTESPIVDITQPTASTSYTTPNSEIELKGIASDNVGVIQVKWSKPGTGESGTCTGLNNWSTYSIPLQTGDNNITVTARDAANNSGSDNLTVTYAPPPGLATVTIAPITEISGNGAVCGGIVTDEGAANVTFRGVCWNTTGYPRLNSPKTSNGAGPGVFDSFISGLSAGTTYYVRAYAINSVGIAYSSQSTFTTIPAAGIRPNVTITNVLNITHTGATSGGNVTAEGGSSVIDRGVCWNTTGGPTVDNSKTTNGSGLGSFSSNLIGLLGNTTYYVRAYATNTAGTGYSDQLDFTTAPAPQYTLSSLPNPPVGGIITLSPLQPSGGYLAGTIVTLTATAYVGYQFGSWSGDAAGTNTSTAVVMYGSRSVTANFAATPLSNTTWFNGRVTDLASGEAIAQAQVQWGDLTGQTDAGGFYNFASVPCMTNNLRVTKSGYQAFATSFSPPCNQSTVKNIGLTRATVKLAVSAGREGGGRARVNGTVQDLPYSGVFSDGATVTLEAAPAAAWAFDYWERDAANYDNDWVQAVVLKSDTSVTAHYVQAPDFQLPAYRQDNPIWRAGNAPKSTNFPDDIVPKLGRSRGNDTWYAVGRLLQLGYDPATLDRFAGASASEFDNVAKGGNPSSSVIPWSSTEPRVGCIAQRESGHVVVVERINADGSFVVSQSSLDVPGGNSDYLYRESTENSGSFDTYIYVPTASAPDAQSLPCGALGGCGASGIMTLALSFVGLGVLRKRRSP